MLIPTLRDPIVRLDFPLRTVGAVRIVFIDELHSPTPSRSSRPARSTPLGAVRLRFAVECARRLPLRTVGAVRLLSADELASSIHPHPTLLPDFVTSRAQLPTLI